MRIAFIDKTDIDLTKAYFCFNKYRGIFKALSFLALKLKMTNCFIWCSILLFMAILSLPPVFLSVGRWRYRFANMAHNDMGHYSFHSDIVMDIQYCHKIPDK